MNTILEAEREFQDLKMTDNIRAEYSVFYQDNIEITRHIETLLVGCGGRILVYGCGDIDITTFAEKGFDDVVGIDISPKSLEKINLNIQEKKLEHKVKTLIMDAHNLTFGNEEFDVVFGTGILHHLDVEKASSEIKRVLKHDGKIIFMEPLGVNPLVNWYRNRTPEARTEFEHPFRLHDIAIMKKCFDISSKGFYLFTILSFGFKVFIKSEPLYKITRKIFLALDAVLLFAFPFLKYLCWIMVLEGVKPEAKK